MCVLKNLFINWIEFAFNLILLDNSLLNLFGMFLYAFTGLTPAYKPNISLNLRWGHISVPSSWRTVGNPIAPKNIPWYDFNSVKNLNLPKGCSLVGVEFQEDSIELPVFRHPSNAAYIFGPEIGNLSPEILKICIQVIKIPTNFSLNVATAGAIILYDRVRTMGKFGNRPVSSIESSLSPIN